MGHDDGDDGDDHGDDDDDDDGDDDGDDGDDGDDNDHHHHYKDNDPADHAEGLVLWDTVVMMMMMNSLSHTQHSSNFCIINKKIKLNVKNDVICQLYKYSTKSHLCRRDSLSSVSADRKIDI